MIFYVPVILMIVFILLELVIVSVRFSIKPGYIIYNYYSERYNDLEGNNNEIRDSDYCGAFYCNLYVFNQYTQNKRFCVPKRFGIGYTINLGSDAGIVTIGVIYIIVTIIILIADSFIQ